MNLQIYTFRPAPENLYQFELEFSRKLNEGAEMKNSQYREDQIVGILKQYEAGVRTVDLCREHGISAER
jgi:hypothetical protein